MRASHSVGCIPWASSPFVYVEIDTDVVVHACMCSPREIYFASWEWLVLFSAPFFILCFLDRNHPEFQKLLAVSISGLLMGCNDVDSDVRMNADECLNRTIKVYRL